MLIDGEPFWLTNKKKGIAKSSFLYVVVRIRLIPTGRDAILDETMTVIVASLLLGFKMNFGLVINNEIYAQSAKLATSLPFPCLATTLCRLARVPILSGVDKEVVATKIKEINKTQDNSKTKLRVHKPSSFGIQTQTNLGAYETL